MAIPSGDNKCARDLPMTQAFIPIQHLLFSRLYKMYKGVVCTRSMVATQGEVLTRRYLAACRLSMVDDGTCGSNKILISKQSLWALSRCWYNTIEICTKVLFWLHYYVTASHQERHFTGLAGGDDHVVLTYMGAVRGAMANANSNMHSSFKGKAAMFSCATWGEDGYLYCQHARSTVQSDVKVDSLVTWYFGPRFLQEHFLWSTEPEGLFDSESLWAARFEMNHCK
ncbi:predicted protein [Lichtheimia corymbifera JMRC:FSU:9682]|uniref:Uncharacterized protein n=1 Tax=Lichtheimia corymbifera JMRC:FSU:9682 TaxID=1263082 RepID=A0A068S022_9FUNG|nr:predicted protein [Lichtheimia corymbifera JMRC:FSU:9682]